MLLAAYFSVGDKKVLQTNISELKGCACYYG